MRRTCLLPRQGITREMRAGLSNKMVPVGLWKEAMLPFGHPSSRCRIRPYIRRRDRSAATCHDSGWSIETGIVTIPGNQDLARLRVEIVMEEPYARSTIRVGLQGRDEDDAPHMINPVSRNYQMGYSDGVFDPPFQPAVPTDLTHTHSFSEKAIYRVAQEFR